MKISRNVEAGLALAGLIALGVLGYWALEQGQVQGQVGARGAGAAPGAPAGSTDELASGANPTPGSLRPALGASSSSATIAGTVRDRLTGAGVAGVAVRLLSTAGIEHTTESGPDGRYSLAVPAGRYRARAVGAEVASLAGAFADADAAGRDSVSVGAAATDDGAEQAWLSVAPEARIDDFDLFVVALARIRGRVVDSDGEPLAEAHVYHHTVLLDRVLGSAQTSPQGEALSDREGDFVIATPPGEVTLIASAAGYPPNSTLIHWVAPGADLAGVEIVLERGYRVTGQVVDESGAAVAGARVRARSQRGELAPAALGVDVGAVEAESDAGGLFQLAAVPPGRAVLQAEAEGYATSRAQVVALGDEPGAERAVAGVRLVVVRERTIAGRVVDERGAGVAGATVTAVPGLGELGGSSTESGSGGEFVLTGVGVGPFFVRARASGYVEGQLSGVAPPADGVEISLLPAGVIEGRARAGDLFVSQLTAVLTRRGPDPASAALDAGFWSQTRSFLGPDGVFRFDDVPPGRYDLTVASPGFAPSEVVGIVLSAGERRAVAVSLGAGASLTGTVRDATTDAPVVGAMVRLDTGSVNQLAHSDSQGRFLIDDIAPGRRSLTVRHPAYVGRIETGLTLVGAAHAEIALTLEPVPFGSDETIEFAGIGAVLAMDGELLRVRGVLPRGPAALAGLVDDDAVVSIDGEPTGGRSFGDNIEAVRGVAGTVVRLEVLRGDQQRTFDVVRATVRFRPEEPSPPGDDESASDGDESVSDDDASE